MNMKNKDNKRQTLYIRTYKILQNDRNDDQIKRNNQKKEKWNAVKETFLRISDEISSQIKKIVDLKI